MAIQEFYLDLSPVDLPETASSLIAEADRRIDEFFETERNKRYPRFIPSDSRLHYIALDYITRNDLTLGPVYCEWGSGFGVGTCLASLLGYDAWGIEIEPELVEISLSLSDHRGIPIEIVCGDYIPEGFGSYEGVGGEVLLEPDSFAGTDSDLGIPAYDGMDIPLDEVDLFYVYPWPGQQEFMIRMFDAVAGEGAILLINLENGEIGGYRRVFEE